jgi:trans-aconitate 2-methyltransferase
MSREWNATAYDRISGPQITWGKKVLASLSLRGNETILDAGCGTGRLTVDLLEALPEGRVVALDFSQNMLRTARENLQAKFEDKVSFLAADLLYLPFDHVFDGIFSTAAFHWVLDHERLFRELFCALKPGGWLVAQCGGGANLARLRQRAIAILNAPPYAEFFEEYREPWLFADAETTASRLRNAGFTEVETSLEPAPTDLQKAVNYAEFLKNVIFHRHLDQIPDEALRHQFIATLTDTAAKDDPPFSLDYWRLNLKGRVPE